MSNSRVIPLALKVKGDTNPGSLAKSLVETLREQGERGEEQRLHVRAMGPHAVNQMVKGLIIAQQQVAANARTLFYRFGFDTRTEATGDITAIQATVTLGD